MQSIPSLGTAAAPGKPWPDRGPQGVRARDRQAAVRYLQVAARSDDAVARAILQRRAAQLILPARPRTAEVAGSPTPA
jgi:hypothetical protein